LPQRPPGAGRPKTYCSPTCRRAAAFEISRVTRAINDLEASLSHFRTSTLAMIFPNDVPLIEAELALQRERLHQLLLDTGDDEETAA
jgi:hypothetical protein